MDENNPHTMPPPSANGNPAASDLSAASCSAWVFVEILRSEEGDSVTILCDNPDFDNGQPDTAIECCGEWTGWKTKRFAADNVFKCLKSAAVEKQNTKTTQSDK